MPSSLLGILRPTWPAPDVTVCEVVQHGVKEAGQGGQEGLEGVLVPGEGQRRLGESRRTSLAATWNLIQVAYRHS